jgi:hypothetical protein
VPSGCMLALRLPFILFYFSSFAAKLEKTCSLTVPMLVVAGGDQTLRPLPRNLIHIQTTRPQHTQRNMTIDIEKQSLCAIDSESSQSWPQNKPITRAKSDECSPLAANHHSHDRTHALFKPCTATPSQSHLSAMTCQCA